ncbi:YitT family protein [Anaerobacillus sp. 1_MG-2023]|uniref:YczE/YyaS/YitT family protein n=1 Tax=Bacillales TaxID=1385 RepID=UPI0026E30B0F|nr:hypothetical protein [Anaerobacillus sp. 1_MG-2023]MDO6654890.1 hypothetical protein [Anaerobacillus sp. 1_MG-2023]
MVYRITVYLLGMFINFFGVALVIHATLGAGFWTSFFIGLSDLAGLTVGFWYGLFQILVIFLNGNLMKQKPEYGAILPIILESFILDFWLEIVFSSVQLASAPLMAKIAILIAGMGAIGLGVAIYILPQFPRAPFDQLFLVISSRFNLSLQMGQTIVAVVMASLALMIGGPVGVGTIALVFLLGPIIQFWYERAYPLYYVLYPAQAPHEEYL